MKEFVGAAPLPQRCAMQALIALTKRPRGRALLTRAGAADQLAQMLTSLGLYDDPTIARTLGWDAEAVVARGHALRQAEGRP
ncbi:MAG TPA: hypothetical protein VHS55_09195 [Solirubrobacteraceae bacterium]|nr:hypothetical protein [Solirubrobacteraceae bacterium]